MKFCNICGCVDFIDMGSRKNVKCNSCNSLERHRLVRWALEQLGFLNKELCTCEKRVLHLAPEEMTHRYLAESFRAGYVCSDLFPAKFPHAKCLKLALPEGFFIFPVEYFDLILHNHVLEHIPGDYCDHIHAFIKLLRPGGNMIFTIPPIRWSLLTVQGGENLPTDDDRARLHGQGDHYKTFGYDLYELMKSLPGSFEEMNIPYEVRETLKAPADSVFVFTKTQN